MWYTLPGSFCPLSQPHACKNGTMCSDDPWKPRANYFADCDGGQLLETDRCCNNPVACDVYPDTCQTHPVFGEDGFVKVAYRDGL